MKESQNQAILKHLLKGNKLTGLQALDKFGCWRLPSRIHDLKKDGHDIDSKTIITKEGKRISQYFL